MSNTTLAIDAPQGRKVFVFDRVFSPDVEQAGVWDYLEEGVSSFTAGYNVSLMAYGQSGAGKSYTMGTSGPNEQDDFENMGKLSTTPSQKKLRGYPGNRDRNSAIHLLNLGSLLFTFTNFAYTRRYPSRCHRPL